MASGEADPDADLLAGAARGDRAAARMLVERKLPRLTGLAYRLLFDAAEAEDVAQEAFLRLWRQARRWRRGGARLDTWLHRVTLNLCYDRLRRRRRIGGVAPELADEGPGPERGLMAQDAGRRVAAAMAALPERQREAIVLCHYQELSNIEAAQVLTISVQALESLLSRGRRALRLALADLVE